MLLQFVYVILALFGISFLIFIHELGHYFMAKRAGITVETFSVGFGKSLIEWKRNGVLWKIGWLPFGGYVKMAGMEKQGPIEPHQIKDGFFGAKPWDRIKVAFMGPLVNIVFAFVAFSLIWVSGGRNKPFREFTHYIGWVDSDSALYKEGIRPGDEIKTINGKKFKSFEDFISSSALDNQPLAMSGCQINYWTGKKIPFTYTFPHQTGQDPIEEARQIPRMILPADYLLVRELQKNSPLINTGLTKGDRIVWVNGELIFSPLQMIQLLNSNSVLLTVERNGKSFLTRIPLFKVNDLRLTEFERGEIDDWSYEARLEDRVEDLFFIPYNISAEGIVENPVGYIDDQSKSQLAFNPPERSSRSIALEEGDRILAVQGKPISTGHEILREVQNPTALVIIKKGTQTAPVSPQEADKDFISSFDIAQMNKILQTLGASTPVTSAGNLILLPPVTPIPLTELQIDENLAKQRDQRIEQKKKEIEQSENAKQKEEGEKELDFIQNRKTLGVHFLEKKVSYNPPPYVLFSDVFKNIYRTLYALISGFLSPKHVSGPIGMMQIMHYGWSLGFNEALYWLGMISLNLGLLNLFPIPFLDGGNIVFSFWEMLTKKPLKAKTMERLIIPFVILIACFFIYLTYNDILRIFQQFFS